MPPWEKYEEKRHPSERYQSPVTEAVPTAQPKKQSALSWMAALQQAGENIPSSAMKFGEDIAQPFMHPLKTLTSLWALQRGLTDRLGLPSMVPVTEQEREVTGKVGQFLANRYGGMENIKKTVATDPVGSLADLSLLLSGGGGLAARAPGVMGRAGQAAGQMGRALDPVTMASRTLKSAGRGGAYAVGALGTHTGAQSLREAFSSGARGGGAGRTFRAQMRGKAPPEAIVEQARTALDQMRVDRANQYRAGMTKVTQDTAILDFNKVRSAVDDVADVGKYKGVNINPKAADVWDDINNMVEQWAGLDPAQFHTVEGIDALKQAIGNIRKAAPPGTPSRVVANDVYRGIRKVITDQAPEYSKVMKGYEEASDLIEDIERTMSLGEKASVDTAVRKLQSVMRNNVNTTYGRRVDLAKALSEKGAPDLMPAIAGQALNTWTPRGLGGVVGPASAGYGAYQFGLSPELAALMTVQSPRVMGEASHLAGQASQLAPSEALLRLLSRGGYQAGRLP